MKVEQSESETAQQIDVAPKGAVGARQQQDSSRGVDPLVDAAEGSRGRRAVRDYPDRGRWRQRRRTGSRQEVAHSHFAPLRTLGSSSVNQFAGWRTVRFGLAGRKP